MPGRSDARTEIEACEHRNWKNFYPNANTIASLNNLLDAAIRDLDAKRRQIDIVRFPD
jgi:hypothetical protein